MLERNYQTIPTRPTDYPFGVRVVATVSAMAPQRAPRIPILPPSPDAFDTGNEVQLKSISGQGFFSGNEFMFPSSNPLFEDATRRSYEWKLMAGRAKVLPPIEHSADNPDQPQRLGMKNALFPYETKMEEPPKTTANIMFTPRERTQLTIHTRLRPKPQRKATGIVPTESEESGTTRLLPSVDREKMVEIPCQIGKSKKILDDPTKASGVFYSESEVQESKEDPKYWKSLTALWGKKSSRKRDLPPTQPPMMTVHYFNGGAPGSPLRQNRRTNMQHKRGDSSRVDFSRSLYGRDKEEPENDKNYI